MRFLPSLPFETLKRLRPDLNEKSFFLSRAELTRVYGRAAFAKAIAHARSVERLDPLVKERYLLEKRRALLEGQGASLDAPPHGAELGAIAERLGATAERLGHDKRALLAAGVDLDDPADELRARQITLADHERRACAPITKAFHRALERHVEETFDAAIGAAARRFASARHVLRQLVIPSVESMLLACPSAHGSDFCFASLRKATLVVCRILHHPFTRSLDEASVRQLFQEVLKVAIYPRYAGEIAVGIGGTTDEPSIRLPSYILPAIAYLQAFVSEGLVPPRIRVASAYAIATSFNGIDPVLSKRNADDTIAFLSSFVERFFPGLQPLIDFTAPVASAFVDNAIYREAVAWLRSFAREHPDNRQLLSLVGKAWKRGETFRTTPFASLEAEQREQLVEIAMSYVACHVVEGLFGDVRLADDAARAPEYVIKAGGAGERDFNFSEELLANLETFDPLRGGRFFRPNTSGLGDGARRSVPIQVTTTIGKYPPYYWASPDELSVKAVRDLSFEEMVDHYRVHPVLQSVASDLASYAVMGVEGEAYVSFLREIRPAGGQPPRRRSPSERVGGAAILDEKIA